MKARSTPTPAIVRIAGITSDCVTELVWKKAAVWAAELDLRKTVQELREEVADALYREVPLHAPKQRRLLLNLRRDCHNGRTVADLLSQVLQLELQGEGLPALLQRLLDLERRAAETEAAYAAEYALRHTREVEILTLPLHNAALCRGLMLASSSFGTEIEGLRRDPGASALRGGRSINTLVRYITRAACKLSPYSTLTPGALAEITPVSGSLARYVAGGRTMTSNLRVQRYLVDQWCEVLRRLPSVRPYLRVGLNRTVRRVGEAQYRFLRPPQLLVREGSLTYSRYEQITVRIGGSLPALLLASPPQGSLLQLTRDLEAAHPDSAPEDLCRAVERLIEIGFLTLAFPITSYHPHFERALRDFLMSLPPAPPLPEVVLLLDEIVQLEESYATAPDPLGVTARVEAATEEVYGAAHSQLPEEGARLQKNPRHNLYEDCFEVSAAHGTGAIVELDESSLRAAMDAGNLIWQIANFHDSRHEILLTLEAFLDERFPGQELVPVLDLFDLFRPIWEEYLAFLADKQQTGPFDPLSLASIADLVDLRLRLGERLKGRLQSAEEIEFLPIEELRQIVADLPSRWLNPLGPSLFLQPVDLKASAWVVNRIFEGNGRMSSRYTTSMPVQVRERYLQHYKLRSTLDVEGEPAELLDLQYTKKNTSSIHFPQTRKVLLVPGESADPQDAQTVEARELFVRRLPSRPLAIVDAQGNRFIPSFLSPIANPFLPSIVKFLDVFGYGMRGHYSFQSPPISSPGMVRNKRQTVGNLVLKRATWSCERDFIPSPDLEPEEFFLEIQRWRAKAGIPREAYMIEQSYDQGFHGEVSKPQYLCFDSVTLVEMLRESLRKRSGGLFLIEALPGAADFPNDPELGTRAVEVLVEWLALTASEESRSCSPQGEIYQPEPRLPITQEVSNG